MKTLSLLQDWKLREEPLTTTAEMAFMVEKTTDNWMEVPTLPCDVHDPLIAAGKIEEPLIADHTFACDFIENRSWWFQKTFSLKEEDISQHGVELFIEMLDVHADIFLNGSQVAHHASAMYAFRKDVRPWLKVGENTLLIRLTTGAERVYDDDVSAVRDFVACEYRSRREGRGFDKRTGLRKPQYVFGWDQSPHLATCAIVGDVRLDILDEIVVRHIQFETLELSDEGAKLFVEAEIENRQVLLARDHDVELTLEYDGEVVYSEKKDYLAGAGVNFCTFVFTLKNPKLWWPNGYGEQPLYTVRVRAVNNFGAKDESSALVGIRTILLDQTRINETERKFRFIVNGKFIYCRGMDVIHNEVLYARTTKEQHEKTFTAARDANFNMVRFWDGYLYQTDYVHELCDKYGIMVLENFCFACGAYPDHLEDFRRECETEAIYQIKRLRSHPCVALWIGNGECHDVLYDYLEKNYFDEMDPAFYTGGTYLYNQLFPNLVRSLTKTQQYKCSSPWGSFQGSECGERGEVHYYPFLNLSPEMHPVRISVESFDPLNAKFVTEGGVMGVPEASAFERYLGGREHYEADDKVFEHHRNTFDRHAVRDGIYKHFTGERKLSFEEYCLYGGLFQGLMLEYEADHMRMMPHCGGNVLWCLTDGFGEVGFSLLDHDVNPKPAYYYLSRAYSPVRIMMRQKDGVAQVYCSNGAPTDCKMEIVCGYVEFDGAYGKSVTLPVDLPAYTHTTLVGTMPVSDLDLTNGIVYAKVEGREDLTTVLRSGEFKTLNITKKATLTLSDIKESKEELSFTVTSDIYAYAVHFGLGADKRFSDQYFNLLPGESRRITLKNPGNITAADLKPDCIVVQ